MRIGLNLLYLKPGIVGGTESYAIGLISELKNKLKHKNIWIFINEEIRKSGLFDNRIAHVIRCPVPAKLTFFRYIYEQFVLPIQVKILKLDLLHSLGYVQPLHLSCKSVVTIHDLNFLNIGEVIQPIRRLVLKYFVTKSAKKSDHIITVSNFSKNEIVKALNIPPQKITITYNSIKTRSNVPLEFQAISKMYSIKKPYLLALGSSSPHKNIKRLLEAFLMLKKKGRFEGQLVISGHIPKMKNELTHLTNDISKKNNIITTGYIPDSHLAVLYKNAEVFVFPSLYEGFGIPVIEAFYYGAPVACSNVSAIPEIAGDAAVYFNPKDVYDIANAIDLLIKDKNKRLELVSKGRARLSLFTWEKAADITLKVYYDVLNK